jgi:hypothetical protein
VAHAPRLCVCELVGEGARAFRTGGENGARAASLSAAEILPKVCWFKDDRWLMRI